MKASILAMTGKQHQELSRHLLPGDGLEAAAVLLCGRGEGRHHRRLVVSEILHLPHELSIRSRNRLTWPFERHLPPERIGDIDVDGQSIVTIHSHPSGLFAFSPLDDENDHRVLGAVSAWFDDGRPVGSAIMIPDGRIRGRTFVPRHGFLDMHAVAVVGDTIRAWHARAETPMDGHHAKLRQTFCSGTLAMLRRLRVGVVGCSGTGSIVVELLVRNGVGTIVVADDDRVEDKNLNRILNSTRDHARRGQSKVEAIAEALRRMDLGTRVEPYESLTDSSAVVAALNDCDAIFGCVDSAFGRYHMESLATACCIPYFDVGVRLDADGSGAIQTADAVSHYVHPEGTSLLSRGAYTMEQVAAENIRRHDPHRYADQRAAGYLAEVGEEQPAVISLNMQAACLAFNDFLARLHRYRLDCNREFATQRLRLVQSSYEHEADTGPPHELFSKYTGMGDRSLLVRNNTVSYSPSTEN